MKRSAGKADIWILRQGALTLVRPLTQRASEWISQHVHDDPQWFGPALVLEHDCLADLRNRMIEDGLHVTQSFHNNEERVSQIPKVSAQLAAASPSSDGLEASKFAAGRIRGGGLAPPVLSNNQ